MLHPEHSHTTKPEHFLKHEIEEKGEETQRGFKNPFLSVQGDSQHSLTLKK